MVDTTLFDLTGKVALLTGASKGMGKAMAGILAPKGFDARVYDLNPAPMEELAAAGAKLASGCREVGEHAEVLSVCVPGDPHVEAVLLSASLRRSCSFRSLTRRSRCSAYLRGHPSQEAMCGRWPMSLEDEENFLSTRASQEALLQSIAHAAVKLNRSLLRAYAGPR